MVLRDIGEPIKRVRKRGESETPRRAVRERSDEWTRMELVD